MFILVYNYIYEKLDAIEPAETAAAETADGIFKDVYGYVWPTNPGFDVMAAFFPPAFFPPAFSPPAFCPSAFFPPQAAILPPVDCDYILSYSIHSLTLLFALLNMLSHCCVVLACSVAPN